MTERQRMYEVGQRILITGSRSGHSGKTGIITGIFCAGVPDKEQYVVHIDGDHEITRVYHVFREELQYAD